MAVPFKSTVFTGGSFSASGSNGHGSAGLLIYSASRTDSGLMPAADLLGIGKDTFVYVSGVIGSRGTTKPGSFVLGGDLIISGTAYYSDGTVLGSGGGGSSSPVYFTSPQNGLINTTGSITAAGSLTVSGSTILGDNTTDTTTVSGSLTSIGILYGRSGFQVSGSSGVTGSLVIKDDTGNTAQLTLSSSAGRVAFDYYSDGNLYVTNNKAAGEVWFSTTQPDTVGSQFLRVKPQNGGKNLVLFNNGMTGGSAANAESSSDTSFFVNGIANSRGTTTRGTAVFGGDLYVSGTVYSNEFKSTIISSSIVYSSGSTLFGNSEDDTHIFTGSIYASSISGSITRLPGGISYLVAGTNVTIASGTNGQITISSTGGGGGSSNNFLLSTTAGSVYSTGSFAFVGDEAGVDSPADKGADNFFYVSGSIGKRGTAQGRNALFGGDVVVSGSTYASGTIYIGQAGAYIGYSRPIADPTLLLNSPGYMGVTVNNDYTNLAYGSLYNYALGDNAVAFAGGGSNAFYVLNTNDADKAKYLLKITDPGDNFTPTIDFGNSSSGTSQFNFYGEIYSRDVIRANTSIVVGDTLEARVVTASYGLTGSLTRLSDGRSYLAAGSNVTITSESNGQITINSSGGGGGSPAGSNTYVQFNDSGSFGASSGLSFEKATNTLTGVTINASTGFSGSHTKLANGTSLIAAGVTSTTAQTGSIAVTTGSTGQITVSSYVFPSDLTVSLTGGKTFGRYANGETIPATGKTPAEVILLAIAQPINPTVATPTATNILTSVWNTTGSVNTSLTGSYTINTLGASVASARLEFRSGSGTWTVLTTSTSTPLLYDHTFTVGTNFTSTLNYSHIVVDSAGAVATGSVTLTPQTYAAPTVGAITLARTTLGGITGESNTTRERGNTVSAITGTITRQRTNAPLSGYAVQYRVNSTGGYTGVPGLSGSIPAASSSFTFTGLHNEAALLTSVTSALDYIVSVVDTWQTSSLTPSSNTISFLSAIFYGTGSAAPTTSADVRSLPNKVFTSTANPFTLNTGATNRFFTVALPTRNTSHDTITSVTDTDALGADITANYVNSAFSVGDGGGVNSTYNVYTMEVSVPYSSDHRHVVTRA